MLLSDFLCWKLQNNNNTETQLFFSISAISLGTCEKAKACEYRES